MAEGRGSHFVEPLEDKGSQSPRAGWWAGEERHSGNCSGWPGHREWGRQALSGTFILPKILVIQGFQWLVTPFKRLWVILGSEHLPKSLPTLQWRPPNKVSEASPACAPGLEVLLCPDSEDRSSLA